MKLPGHKAGEHRHYMVLLPCGIFRTHRAPRDAVITHARAAGPGGGWDVRFAGEPEWLETPHNECAGERIPAVEISRAEYLEVLALRSPRIPIASKQAWLTRRIRANDLHAQKLRATGDAAALRHADRLERQTARYWERFDRLEAELHATGLNPPQRLDPWQPVVEALPSPPVAEPGTAYRRLRLAATIALTILAVDLLPAGAITGIIAHAATTAAAAIMGNPASDDEGRTR